MNSQRLVWTALSVVATGSQAAPIDLIVDPARSSIDLTISVDVGIASDSDSDSSPLSGFLRAEFDDNANPTQISLHDLLVNIDNDLNFNWSFGFFGGADATLSGGVVTWGFTDAIVGPVPIVEGDFVLPDVPVALQGTMAVNYDILLVGSGSELINLIDQGDFLSTLAGSVAVQDATITLSSTLPIDATTPLVDDQGNELGTLTVTGTATLVATADAPGCPADITGDGLLNFFDVSTFINAFDSNDPLADFDGNGVINFFDVSDFLGAFTAGCP